MQSKNPLFLDFKYISHAGGAIDNLVYSNSLEALENSVSLGYQFIEIDIQDSLDEKFVLIHDWQETSKKLLGQTGKISAQEFLSKKIHKKYQALDLDSALNWLKNHPELYFILDIKAEKPEEIAKYIKNNHPDIMKQIIPQIYLPKEYDFWAQDYQNIVFALYKTKLSQDKILDFIKRNKILAISISQDRISSFFAKELKSLGVKIFVFTVNEQDQLTRLKKFNIDAVFTDYLI
jgi:glycerophosphoryl diester phosphodiesterase